MRRKAAAASAALVVLVAVTLWHPRAEQNTVQRPGIVRSPQAPGQGRDWPEGPRVRMTVDAPAQRGQVRQVRAGMDLQAAIDAAQPGDTLVLEAGARFIGPFTLPDKAGEGWIVIRSEAADRLPPQGVRVRPQDARFMAVLEASDGPVVMTRRRAHHYWFTGLELRPGAGALLDNVVQFGLVEDEAEDLPHHLVIERSYIHGDAQRGTRRGVALNAAYAAIVDSHLSDFKEVGADSQAIAGWNGPGPFRIANNYLEGAGENLMFGGADPEVRDLVPSDIEIIGNHFRKPPAWRQGDRDFRGRAWTVKNILELKNARRVVIQGNLFEQNWAHGQDGTAILFTPRNQNGDSPWTVVEDVAFVHNVVRDVGSGMKILGKDDNHQSQQTRRILVADNLFDSVGGPLGGGRLLQLLDGVREIVVEHNTALLTGSFVVGGDHEPHAGFVFRHNVVTHGEFGLIGSGTGVGRSSMERYFPDAELVNNVIIGGESRLYPSGNHFPANPGDVFVSPATRDYRVKPGSAAAGAAPGGRDIGVDISGLRAAWAAEGGGRP